MAISGDSLRARVGTRVFNPHVGIDMTVTDDDVKMVRAGLCDCDFCMEIAGYAQHGSISRVVVEEGGGTWSQHDHGLTETQRYATAGPVLDLREQTVDQAILRRAMRDGSFEANGTENPTIEEIALREAWAELDAIDQASGLDLYQPGGILWRACKAPVRTVRRYPWTSAYMMAMAVLGILYETLLAGEARPALLMLWSALMGMPFFLAITPEKPAMERLEKMEPSPQYRPSGNQHLQAGLQAQRPNPSRSERW